MKLRALFLSLALLSSSPHPATASPSLFCPTKFAEAFRRFFPEKSSEPKTSVASAKAHAPTYDGKSEFSPERLAIHEKIMAPFKEAGKAVSAALSRDGNPILVLTRGNSGAGKTYSITHAEHPTLKRLGLKDIVEKNGDKGVINPDSIKAVLQNEVEKGIAVTEQVHEEGSYLAKQWIDEMFSQRASFVVDKRFGSPKSLAPLLKKAKEGGYRVVMVDVDASISESASRIVKREIGSGNANVPLSAIMEGASEARGFRAEIAATPEIDEYLLFRNGRLVAERRGPEKLKIHQHRRWKEATDNKAEAEKLRAEILYGDLLDALSETLPAETLRPYLAAENLPPPRAPMDFGERLKVSDLRYEVKKGGEQESHVKLARALGDYVQKYAPGSSYTMDIAPEIPDRISSVILRLKVKDQAYARRLLADGNWPFHLSQESDSLEPEILLDTRELALGDPETLVEREIMGVGESAPRLEESGSIGHEFIKARNSAGRLHDSPPLAFVRPTGKINLAFSKGADKVKFREGFRSDEAQAYGFGVRVELSLAIRALEQNEIEAAKSHLKFARANLVSAHDFNNPILYHFGEGKKLDVLKMEGLTPAQENELHEWSRKFHKEMEILEKEIRKIDREIKRQG